MKWWLVSIHTQIGAGDSASGRDIEEWIEGQDGRVAAIAALCGLALADDEAVHMIHVSAGRKDRPKGPAKP